METLILDGIWGNHKRWEPLKHRISNSVGQCSIWRYDTSGKTRPSESAKVLSEWIAKREEPVALVGYSMGGIVSREAARILGDKGISAAALLHCPHHGTLWGDVVKSPATEELRPGSDLLQSLPQHTFPTMTTWCPFDLVVVPGSSAKLSCTKSFRIDIPAHNAPVWARSVHDKIIQFLKTTTQDSR